MKCRDIPKSSKVVRKKAMTFKVVTPNIMTYSSSYEDIMSSMLWQEHLSESLIKWVLQEKSSNGYKLQKQNNFKLEHVQDILKKAKRKIAREIYKAINNEGKIIKMSFENIKKSMLHSWNCVFMIEIIMDGVL